MRAADSTKVDRLPPHAPDAERGVLGCILLAPADCLDECSRIMPQGADAFYDLRHQELYRTAARMHAEHRPVDAITLSERLRGDGRLEAVGGLLYVNELADGVPSAANLAYYVEDLVEKWKRRQIIAACSNAIADAYAGDHQGDDLVDRVESAVHGVRNRCDSRQAGPISGTTLAQLAIDRMERRREGMSGISSGFRNLDRVTDGFRPGEVSIIAASPSGGKTSLLLNIAAHIALDQGMPVGFLTLEQSKGELAERLTASRARVNLRAIRDWTDADFAHVHAANLEIAERPNLHIDDAHGFNIVEVRAAARRLVRRQGAKALFVDYLQKIEGVGRRAENARHESVAEVSRGLQTLAKELVVPIIAGAQLVRDFDSSSGRPDLKDVAESYSIARDADFVGILFRKTKDSVDAAQEDRRGVIPMTLWVAKQRDGERNRPVDLTFHPRFTRFEDASLIDPKDMPHR